MVQGVAVNKSQDQLRTRYAVRGTRVDTKYGTSVPAGPPQHGLSSGPKNVHRGLDPTWTLTHSGRSQRG